MKQRWLIILFLFSSCVFDHFNKIVLIKNQSPNNIIAVYGDIAPNDKRLFYGTKYNINANSVQEIIGPSYKGDSLFVWLYNADTVYSLIKMNQINGIVEKSFIKKHALSVDSLKLNRIIIYP